jgi:hypothetical protein
MVLVLIQNIIIYLFDLLMGIRKHAVSFLPGEFVPEKIILGDEFR